jgi:ATP-dependent DNA ligase
MRVASAFIEPCLPSRADRPPSGPDWIHEIKLDGFRMMVRRGDLPPDVVFRHACKLGFEGIVSKRLGSSYRSGRSRDWLKMKNPNAPAVKREAEEDWGREKWR